MSESYARAKSKPKHSHYSQHCASETRGLDERDLVRNSSSHLNGFYSAGPVFGLGLPVQKKVSIGGTDDPFEREADAVAGHATSDTNTAPPPISDIRPGQLAQRKQDEEQENDDAPIQMQPEGDQNPGADEDREVQLQSADEDNQDDIPVQRQVEENEEPVQTKAGSKTKRNPREMEEEASRAIRNRGSGMPMLPPVRSRLESRLGVDLSEIRIHTGEESQDAAKKLKARAFTHRSNIWLGAGEQTSDVKLLAHETAHVLQQGGINRRSLNKEARTEEASKTEGKQQISSLTGLQPSATEHEIADSRGMPSLPPTPGTKVPGEKLLTDKVGHTAKPAAAITSSVIQTGLVGQKQITSGMVSEAKPDATLESAGVSDGEKEPVHGGSLEKASTGTSKEHKVTKKAAEPAPSDSREAGKAVPDKAKVPIEPGATAQGEEGTGSALEGPASPAASSGASSQGGIEGGSVPEEGGQEEEAEAEKTRARMANAAGEDSEESPEEEESAPAPEIDSGSAAIDEKTMSSAPSEVGGGEMSAGGEVIPDNDLAEETAKEEEPSEAERENEEETESEEPAATGGSAELAPAERDAAMSSLAEGAEGTGEPALPGGSGGGGVIEDKPEPEVPDVSGQEPSQAIGAISNLPPAQMQAALGGVSTAVSRSVGEQRTELSTNPPKMDRPSGAPATRHAPISAIETSLQGKKSVDRVPEGKTVQIPEPKPLPPAPSLPVASVPAPRIQSGGQMSGGDAEQLSASIRNLPTTDPGLDVSAGAPPPLILEGASDPARISLQQEKLDNNIAEAQSQGQRDAKQPMGETEIFPIVPPETLQSNVPASGAGAGSSVSANAGAGINAGRGGNEKDEAASIIAQEQHGAEIRAAVSKAQGDVAVKRQEHTRKVSQEKVKNQAEIAKLEAENASEQAGERSKAQAEVQAVRSDWTKEQRDVVDRSNQEANSASTQANADIARERKQGEAEASKQIEEGDREASRARQEGEIEAAKERKRGENESSGFFSWVASKATAFFDSIKRGIKAAFEKARAAVRWAIEKAKKLAMAVIEKARKAIVDAIRKAGDILIAIGDKLLAGFPAMRDRFRKAIKDRVARAEAAVNWLAEKLKKGVQRALDLYGAALDAALGLLEKGMLAAVDAANGVVQGAIKAAQAVVNAVAAFASLIKDIASGPGQWISNLGASVVDGIRNHLWKAFKDAVKNWFNQKLEEVLGLGTAIWNLLTKGGIALSQIGNMVWEALKSAIPTALIQILIEKLVSMIVPAAGAVMVIIEGLQAAWGTVSRIISAFGLFFTFLKAVKKGNAGPQFSTAVAAAVIVVIDFVANWLLRRLRKPAGKVAGKIRAIAQRIMQKVKKVAKKIGGKLKGLGGKVKAKLKNVAAKFRKRKAAKGAPKPKKPKKSKSQKDQERLNKAVRELRPKIQSIISRGIAGLRLTAQLLIWRKWYRLKGLNLERKGNRAAVIASNSPGQEVGNGYMPKGEELRNLIRKVVDEILEHEDVKEASEWIGRHKEGKESAKKPEETRSLSEKEKEEAKKEHEALEIAGGVSYLGRVRHEREAIAGATKDKINSNIYSKITPEARIHESQTDPSLANARVNFGRLKGNYPDLAKNMETIMTETRMSNRQMAKVMTDVVKTGELPGHLIHHKTALAGLAQLMFVREGIRNPMSVAMAPMTMELISKGNITFETAFSEFEGEKKGSPRVKGGRGVFPASMKNAQKAYNELEKERNRPDRKKRKKDAKELARREIAIADRWLTMQMTASGHVVFIDETDAKEYIKDRLLKYYNLRKKVPKINPKG